MPIRKIIEIEEEKCTGCGLCIVDCAEGALEIIDGKAKVVKDSFCDGLGACIGSCPEDALHIVERDVDDFDEAAVEEHLKNLAARQPNGPPEPKGEGCDCDCGDDDDKEKLTTLQAKVPSPPPEPEGCGCSGGAQSFDEPPAAKAASPFGARPHGAHARPSGGGCPGSALRSFDEPADDGADDAPAAPGKSKLRQWPIQLKLLPPSGPLYDNKDILLFADCVGGAYADAQRNLVKGHTVIMTCPKLDDPEPSVYKLSQIFQEPINKVAIAIMEVPCCSGLVSIAKEAMNRAGVNKPIEVIRIGIRGDLLGRYPA